MFQVILSNYIKQPMLCFILQLFSYNCPSFLFVTRFHLSCWTNSSLNSPQTLRPSSSLPTLTITRLLRCWYRKVCQCLSPMRCAVTVLSAYPAQMWTVSATRAYALTSTRPWQARHSSHCLVRTRSWPPSSSAGSSKSSARWRTSSRQSMRSCLISVSTLQRTCWTRHVPHANWSLSLTSVMTLVFWMKKATTSWLGLNWPSNTDRKRWVPSCRNRAYLCFWYNLIYLFILKLNKNAFVRNGWDLMMFYLFIFFYQRQDISKITVIHKVQNIVINKNDLKMLTWARQPNISRRYAINCYVKSIKNNQYRSVEKTNWGKLPRNPNTP